MIDFIEDYVPGRLLNADFMRIIVFVSILMSVTILRFGKVVTSEYNCEISLLLRNNIDRKYKSL